jgi:hypothetical protein
LRVDPSIGACPLAGELRFHGTAIRPGRFRRFADGHSATVRLWNMIYLGPRPGEERCHIARVEKAKRAKHGAA